MKPPWGVEDGDEKAKAGDLTSPLQGPREGAATKAREGDPTVPDAYFEYRTVLVEKGRAVRGGCGGS
jgi:hypothetical protein